MSDIEEIRRLAAAYVRHVDDREPSAAADLFAQDGVWDGSAAGLGVRQGRHEILAGFERGAGGPSYFHLTGNHLINLLGPDDAEGSEHTIAVSFAEDGDLRFSLTLLRDRYVRTVDGWRFRSRALQSLGRTVLATRGTGL